MPSILYSTTCFIKNDLYRLRIYVNDDHNHNTENVKLINDFTSTEIPIHHIKPSMTRLNFELLEDKKINSSVPETIILNHLLYVKQTVSIPKKSNQISQTTSVDLTDEISSNSKTTQILEQSQETNFVPMKSVNSQSTSTRRTFSFAKFLSSFSYSDNEPVLLQKTLVKINFVDVSNSIQWNVKSLELQMDTEDVANELCANLNLCLSTLKQRPRRLLCFVNPLSGKGRARFVYDKKVLPLFEEVNINVDTIYTERANHAQNYIINEDISIYDGLVCVGGDGMFAELCHGLLHRTVQDKEININDPQVNLIRPNLRIGIIPAGSTDAVVFGTTGLNNPITSALQIIVGESLFIDITTVHNEQGFVRFMATMLAYGFFGDIIEQSDKWRCLGPLRYDLAGFCQFIRNTSYHSEVTITLSSTNNSSDPSIISSDYQQLIQSTEINHKSTSFCSKNCEKCSEEEKLNLNFINTPVKIKREGRFATINCLNMPCRCAKSKYGMSPYVHLGDGTFDLILVKRSWRTGFLRFLWQVANDGRSIEDLPNVERYRASEVLIRPINTGRKQIGNWSCDGELINGNEIRIRVHRRLLNLFASGIQFKQENIQMKNTNWFNCIRNNKKSQSCPELNSS